MRLFSKWLTVLALCFGMTMISCDDDTNSKVDDADDIEAVDMDNMDSDDTAVTDMDSDVDGNENNAINTSNPYTGFADFNRPNPNRDKAIDPLTSDDTKIRKLTVTGNQSVEFNRPSGVYFSDEIDRAPAYSKDCLDVTDIVDCSSKKVEAYVQNNINYPEEALNEEKEGTQYVAFTVKKDGSIDKTNINVVPENSSKVCSECADAAKRVVNNMSKWEPGMRDGEAVAVQMILPIKFQIRDI